MDPDRVTAIPYGRRGVVPANAKLINGVQADLRVLHVKNFFNKLSLRFEG